MEGVINMTTVKDQPVNVEWTLSLCRTKAGLDQPQMAKLLGVSESTYQKYESYKTHMRVDTAFKFAEIVGLPIDSIIFFKH
jgi:putative transcriptional regulator